ncbi:MAG: phosphatase PAP2 family protein [Thermomicrobiales bacterium]
MLSNWQALRLYLARKALDPGALAVFGTVWLIYSGIRALANEYGLADSSQEVLQIDRWLGAGSSPTERLQAAVYVPGDFGWIDYLAFAIHLSYFLVPFGAGIGIWFFSKYRGGSPEFVDYVAGTGVVLFGGVLINFLIPTAPPWLQARVDGDLEIVRLLPLLVADVSGDRLNGIVGADPNSRAAMPSLHVGITALVVLFLGRMRLLLGVVAMVYVVAMALSLMYLGEHYLIDLIVGSLLALLGLYAIRCGWPYQLVARIVPPVRSPAPSLEASQSDD